MAPASPAAIGNLAGGGGFCYHSPSMDRHYQSESEPAHGTGIGRGIVVPCLLLFGAMFNLTLVVAGLKEFILEELGGSVTDAGLFFTVETLAYILFAPLWGLLSDRLGRRRPFIVLGFVLSALIYAGYGLVQSVPLLLGMRFAQGAFSVMGWSLTMALVMDQPALGRQGRYLGLMGGSLIFGVAVGAPFGGYLTRWLGPRAPLLAAAVLFALLAAAALALREGARLRQGTAFRQIGRVLTAKPLLLFPLLCHFVDRLAVGLFVVIFPLHIDSLGASDPALRGRYLAYFLLPFAFLQFFTGRMVERTGPLRPLVVGSAIYGLLLIAVGVADLVQLVPIMIGLGVAASVMFPPAILLTARLSDARSRATAVGGFNLAGSLGFAVGPVAGAFAFELQGYAFAFALCGLLELLLAGAGWLLLRRRPVLEDDPESLTR